MRLHRDCIKKLYPVGESCCMKCGRPLDRGTEEYCQGCRGRAGGAGGTMPLRVANEQPAQGKALFLYQGAIKETMYRFKYSNKREYADFFAEYALQRYGEWIKKKGIEVIVPVPMYHRKKQLRGYNQAESFAKALAQLTGLPVETGLVERVKDTAPQKELSDAQRKKNLENAFQPKKSIVQYKRILVVDDIYTTGSTAYAVAKALNKDKACEVYLLNICIAGGM